MANARRRACRPRDSHPRLPRLHSHPCHPPPATRGTAARTPCMYHTAHALGEAGLHMEEESGRTVLLLEVAVEVEAHLASADAGS